MKILKTIGIATLACWMLSSCGSSVKDEFVGTWVIESIEEVPGYNILEQEEILTLNNDDTFTQSFAYLDEGEIDTLAIVTIGGTWDISNDYLEMKYDTASVTIICEDEDTKDLFIENITGNAIASNDNLDKAHKNGEQYGIKNVAVKDDKIISKKTPKDNTGETIYHRKK